MSGFVWGIILGVLVTLAMAIVGAMYAYRRFIILERRTRHAERLAELGTLTGGLAHEIKNPLSTVQLNLQLLAEDLSPDADGSQNGRLRNRLSTVQREVSRLREILDDFLRYAGKLELHRKPVDLNRLIDELSDFFAPQAAANRVQLRVRTSDPPVVVSADERLLKQTVLNLMLNAVQAMSADRDGEDAGEGGGQAGARGGGGGAGVVVGGELILAAQRDGRDGILTVTDTGKGVEPGAVDRIFQAYFSTRRSGTGLGLPMAKRIIDEHGGELSVQSEPGKGSAFSIRLPVEETSTA